MYSGTLPPITNQQSWKFIIEVMDADNDDEDIDLTGADIALELRDRKNNCTSLSATTANGKIVILETGFFQVSFDRTDLQSIPAVTYDVGCVITQNGETAQLILGSLPVLDGIVRQ